MGKKGKSGNAKKWLIGIAAVLLSAMVVGTAVRIKRENDDKESTKQEETISIDWEIGWFYPDTGLERIWESGGMPVCNRTAELLPYDEFNVSWNEGLSAVYILFYDESETFLKTLIFGPDASGIASGEFSWEDRETYQFADGTSIPDTATYVRVGVMGLDANNPIDLDEITITYKE